MFFETSTGYTLAPGMKKAARIYFPVMIAASIVLSLIDATGLGILQWVLSPGGASPLLRILALKARSALLLTAGIATAAYCTACRHYFLYLVTTFMFMAYSLTLIVLYGIFIL